MTAALRFALALLLVAAPASSASGSERARLTVAAVGDLMLGSTYPSEFLPPDDGARAFAPVESALRGFDLVFGNLEGPLLDGGAPAKCSQPPSGRCFEFRMPCRYAKHLAAAGFDALNVANNHAFDFGLEGVESTVATLSEVGIEAAGGSQVARLTRRGRGISLLGFSTSPPSRYTASLLDLERAVALVEAAAAGGDLVIVSFHGGAEGRGALHVADVEEAYAGEARGNVVRFARTVIDAGADLVLGHGPHVPRALEVYRGRLVAYSLGNFFTYGQFNTKGPNGLAQVLQVALDADTGELLEGRVVSAELSEAGLPALDPEGRTAALVRSLTEEDRGGGGLRFEGDGRFRPQRR